jgi:N-acetylmuramoyl-L-alanine amidase
MSKKYEYLIIHCTATREGENITPEQIRDWHMGENGRGWSRVGYSDLIMLDGSLVNLHFAKGSNPYDGIIDNHEMTWGARGVNAISKHVCYVGGVENVKTNGKYKPKNTMTEKQKNTLRIYIEHELLRHPNIKIAGHNQFSNKACPSFDVPNFCCEIGLAMKNVHLK